MHKSTNTLSQTTTVAGARPGPVEIDASLFGLVSGGNPRNGGWTVGDNPRNGGWSATAPAQTGDNPRNGGWQ